MPVGLILDFESYTLDDYDRVCAALGFPQEWPEGLLAHGAALADGHLRVTDVWESRATFDAYVQSTLGPTIAATLGDRAREPQIAERELHTFYARA